MPINEESRKYKRLELIVKYRNEGKTLEEIGLLIGGVTRERARQLLSVAKRVGFDIEDKKTVSEKRKAKSFETVFSQFKDEIIKFYNRDMPLMRISDELGISVNTIKECIDKLVADNTINKRLIAFRHHVSEEREQRFRDILEMKKKGYTLKKIAQALEVLSLIHI